MWTANFDDIPMETGNSAGVAGAAQSSPTAAMPEPTGWSSPAAAPTAPDRDSGGWADFAGFPPSVRLVLQSYYTTRNQNQHALPYLTETGFASSS